MKWLDTISPSAVRSLEEGLEETLTLHQLGLNPLLRTSCPRPTSSKLLRPDRALDATRQRWRNAGMVLRWGAAALLVAKAGFQRIKGHAHLPFLKAALERHLQSQLEPQSKAA